MVGSIFRGGTGGSCSTFFINRALFVSSNAWDAAGAKAFGYRVCWCNRSGAAADDLGFPPDFTVTGLDRLPDLY